MHRNTIKIGFITLICTVSLLNFVGCAMQEVSSSTTDITSSTIVEADENMVTITYRELGADEAMKMTPNAYNLEMAIEKNLADSEIYDKNYLEAQAAYLALLNYYLCENAGLDTYQAQMDNSKYNFPESGASIYKTAGAFGRANIYIRNNVYVERLSMENLTLLLESMHNGSIVVSNTLLEMVKNTMEEVISVRYDDSAAEFEAIYDIGAFQTNSAPNNALVLLISYEPEFNEKGNLISEETENEKLTYLEDLTTQIESEMSEKLGINVRVFY